MWVVFSGKACDKVFVVFFLALLLVWISAWKICLYVAKYAVRYVACVLRFSALILISLSCLALICFSLNLNNMWECVGRVTQ